MNQSMTPWIPSYTLRANSWGVTIMHISPHYTVHYCKWMHILVLLLLERFHIDSFKPAVLTSFLLNCTGLWYHYSFPNCNLLLWCYRKPAVKLLDPFLHSHVAPVERPKCIYMTSWTAVDTPIMEYLFINITRWQDNDTTCIIITPALHNM